MKSPLNSASNPDPDLGIFKEFSPLWDRDVSMNSTEFHWQKVSITLMKFLRGWNVSQARAD